MPQQNDILIRIQADLADLRKRFSEVSSISKTAAGDVEGTWEGVTGQFAKLGLAIQGVREAFQTVIAPIRALVDTSAEFETLRTRLTGLYGSVEAGSRAFERFNSVASSTPFSLKQVVEAGAQLKAFGADAEGLILDIANLAAFMGTDIVEAANAFGRAFAGGAGAADILRERGVLQLVKSFNGIEDITKITLPEFRAALISTLEDPAANIAGSSDRLSKTFQGSVSNMQDSLDRFRSAVGDEFLPALTESAKLIGKVFDGMAASAGNAAQAIKDLLTLLGLLAAGLAVVFAGPIIAAVVGFVGAFGVALTGAAGALATLVSWLGLTAVALPPLRYIMGLFADETDRAKEGVAGLNTVLQKPLGEITFKKFSDSTFDMVEDMRKARAAVTLTENEMEAAALLEEATAKRTYETQRAYLKKQLAELLAAGDTKVVEAAKVQIQLEELELSHGKDMDKIREDADKEELDRQKAHHAKLVQAREEHDLLMGRLQLEFRQESAAVDQQILDRNAAFVAQAMANSEASWDTYTAKVQEVAGVIGSAFAQLGQGMQAVFEGQKDAMRNLLKGSLLVVLDYVKQIIAAANLKALADAILSFNPAAIAKNFAILAGIEAAFAVLRSGITAFATGGMVDKATLAVVGEKGREYIVPDKDMKTIRKEWYELGLRSAGNNSKSEGLLQGLNDRMDSIDARLSRLAPAIGRETGRALGTIAREAV